MCIAGPDAARALAMMAREWVIALAAFWRLRLRPERARTWESL
jgi:hypothetical protein